MSILIKGMDIPTSPVLFCIHPDGKVFADLEGGWREYKAVPVPPHGRLGDLDALVKRLESEKAAAKQIDNYDYWYALSVAVDFALAAPTIIPAEEGE